MTEPSAPRETTWPAAWFDGRVALRHAVTVRITATALRIERADGEAVSWPYGEVRQVHGGREGDPVRLEWGGDPSEILVVERAGFLEAVRALAPHYRERFTDARRRRARLRTLIIGAAAALAALGGAYVWLIPALARRVASRVPVAWEESLGRSTMRQLVDSVELCEVPPALDALVDRLARTTDGRYTFQVAVADDSLVNAFAAPGGYVVVYRGLLDLAQTPEELAGVLAHEMQHVVLQHGTQAVLREVPLRLLVATITADAGAAGSIVGAAATLGSLRYSRKAEAAADRAGMRMLAEAAVDPEGMVTLYGRLEQHAGDMPRVAAYLSTHPRTADRIAELRRLAGESRAVATPLLDSSGWETVKRACAGAPTVSKE